MGFESACMVFCCMCARFERTAVSSWHHWAMPLTLAGFGAAGAAFLPGGIDDLWFARRDLGKNRHDSRHKFSLGKICLTAEFGAPSIFHMGGV